MPVDLVAVVLTDTHLNEENFDVVYDKYEQAISVCKKRKINVIIHLGDQFTSRISQKLLTLIQFKKIINLLERERIICYSISGNHDKTDQTVSFSYLHVYKDFSPNFVVVDFGYLSLKGIGLNFLSFYADKEYTHFLQRIIEDCKNRKSKEKQVLLTHIGLDGVLNNDGLKIRNSIKRELFEFFDIVLIGHYHNYSQVSDTIFYIGSTDARNFGEDDNKGCIVLHKDLSIERIPFDFKPYRQITVSVDELQELLTNLDSSKENIRLNIQGETTDIQKISKKEIEKMGFSVVIKDTFKQSEEEEVQETSVIGMDKKQLLREFLEYGKSQKMKTKKITQILKYFQS